MLFIEGEDFAKQAERLLTDSEVYRLQQSLLENPDIGDLIQGTGGARKIRVGLHGRGKRGGARAVYFYRVSHKAVFFLALYAKNEKADLSAGEKTWIRQEVEKIKREVYP
ncbi:MAG TPA: type II toxin-antitoxin system RelE/ParE family toxin [Fibrobacteria bacterium]|nr:type II toxin-antitoxin system RelE/ParE family toxin [Fibrobacteria bacterium]